MATPKPYIPVVPPTFPGQSKRFLTWDNALIRGLKAEHEETVARIKAAGYCFRNYPDPEREDCMVYALYVIFDIHNLGHYGPA